MSTNTPNYNLVKQDDNEFYDVEVVNENLDKIDTAIKGLTQQASTAINNVDNKITQHLDENNAHTIAQITGLQTALNEKLPTTGGTMTGDLSLVKIIPKINFSSPTGVQTAEIRLNVSDTADFGFQMLKNNQIFFDALNARNVRFQDSNGSLFSIQSLKQDCSDAFDSFASAITAKGVPTASGANATTILNNINAIETGGIVSGTVVSSPGTLDFYNLATNDPLQSFPYVTVSLNFKPKMVHIFVNRGTGNSSTTGIYNSLVDPPEYPNGYLLTTVRYSARNNVSSYAIRTNVGNAYVNETGFRLPVTSYGETYSYYAVR